MSMKFRIVNDCSLLRCIYIIYNMHILPGNNSQLLPQAGVEQMTFSSLEQVECVVPWSVYTICFIYSTKYIDKSQHATLRGSPFLEFGHHFFSGFSNLQVVISLELPLMIQKSCNGADLQTLPFLPFVSQKSQVVSPQFSETSTVS